MKINMKNALVLEGGGMRGLYTAGVLDAFLENNIHFDTVIGVSAGALFGVNLLSRQKGRVLNYNIKYINDKRYMSMRSLITTGNFINKEFCYDVIPFKLDVFDFDTYLKSDTDFYAVVTNIETGLAEYIKIADLKKDMDYLRASGSLPFISKPVEINEKKYLDGGIADSIPFEKALDEGYDKIVVVLTRPDGYRKSKGNELLSKIVYRKYPAFAKLINNRYLSYNKQSEKISMLEAQKRIFVIRPSETVEMSRLEKDTEKLRKMHALGLSDANRQLAALNEYMMT